MLSHYFFQKATAVNSKENQVFVKKEFINFIKQKNIHQHKYIDNTFHIVHFENLIDDLKKIKIFKGICDFDNYPKINASVNSKLDYNEILDKELKDLIFNKFKKDFELFGYEY